MARRLDDRPALATVLMRAYWARGDDRPRRDPGHAHGVARPGRRARRQRAAGRGDGVADRGADRARRPRGGARAELAVVYEMASRVGQPFIIHVAEHYRSAIALCDGRLAEAEATAERSFEWGRLLTGRDPSGSYGVQMFGIRREQGRLAELAPVVRILAARTGRQAPGGRASPRCSPSSGWPTRPAASSTGSRRGLAELRAGALARVADLPGRRLLRSPATRTTAAALYAELAPHAGGIVTIGHGGGLLRLRRPLPGDGRRDARRARAGRAPPRDGAGGRPRGWARTLARPHRVRVRPAAPGRRRRGRRGRAAELLAEAAELAKRIGMPVLLDRIRARAARRSAAP